MPRLAFSNEKRTIEININPLVLTIVVIVLGLIGGLALILESALDSNHSTDNQLILQQEQEIISLNSTIEVLETRLAISQEADVALNYRVLSPTATTSANPPNLVSRSTPTPLPAIIAATPRPIYTAIKPNSREAGHAYPDIWESLNFQDLTFPSKATYHRQVTVGQRYNWTFAWCGTDTTNMQLMVDKMSVSFMVNNKPINDDVLTYIHGNCTAWMTVISFNQTETPITLDVQYTINSVISDGTTTYSNGTYTQSIIVNTQ